MLFAIVSFHRAFLLIGGVRGPIIACSVRPLDRRLILRMRWRVEIAARALAPRLTGLSIATLRPGPSGSSPGLGALGGHGVHRVGLPARSVLAGSVPELSRLFGVKLAQVLVEGRNGGRQEGVEQLGLTKQNRSGERNSGVGC